jgi:hypothetical protein
MEPDPSTTSDKTNALIDSGTCIKLPKVSLSRLGGLKIFPIFKHNVLLIQGFTFFVGMVEASELLVSIEEQILRAEYEAESRKEVLERVDKWFAACEEERWLEDYSMVRMSIYMAIRCLCVYAHVAQIGQVLSGP